MRIAWVGFHAEGLPALEGLLAGGTPLAAVLTVEPGLAGRRGAIPAYAALCERYRVPLLHISDLNEPRAHHILARIQPDLLFVIGWHRTLRPATLRLARVGAIGAHAGLLPQVRGSAPINWALIRGDREAGATLYWLSEKPFAGDIIDQTVIPITPYDTAATLYAQVARANRDMLLRVLPRLLAGERPGVPQSPTAEPTLLPRRRAADGRVPWGRSNREVYDFIRALTRPYPGAFGSIDGRTWRIWHAALLPAGCAGGPLPGEVLGPVWSPVPAACGKVVTCGDGGVILLEVEAEDGTVLSGPALSEQRWTGLRWDHD